MPKSGDRMAVQGGASQLGPGPTGAIVRTATSSAKIHAVILSLKVFASSKCYTLVSQITLSVIPC